MLALNVQLRYQRLRLLAKQLVDGHLALAALHNLHVAIGSGSDLSSCTYPTPTPHEDKAFMRLFLLDASLLSVLTNCWLNAHRLAGKGALTRTSTCRRTNTSLPSKPARTSQPTSAPPLPVG